MNLKKLFVTAVAVLASALAFAGNTSDTKLLIDQMFSVADQVDVAELNAEELTYFNTVKAVREGLLAYETNLTAGAMTETDKAIDEALSKQIPAVLNKINESSDEVLDELEPILHKLTEDIISNQHTCTQNQVDMEEIAPSLVWLFAYSKAELDRALDPTPSYVLQKEMAEMMLQSIFEYME